MTSPGRPPATAAAVAPYGQPVPPPPAAYPLEEPPSASNERLAYAGICLVTGVVAALPAAWLWISLADPPSARLTDAGLKFGESDFDHVTTITLWFAVVGFGFGLVLGLVAALFGRRHGLVAVLTILAATWVGASMTVWFGVHVFGPDHPIDFVALFNGTTEQRTQMLQGFQKRELLVSTVRLSSPLGLLGWPMGGMAGALVSATFWPQRIKVPRQTVQITPQMPLS